MGCLKGRQIENITIQISTMRYGIKIISCKLQKEALQKGHSRVLSGGQLDGSLLIQSGGFSSSSR